MPETDPYFKAGRLNYVQADPEKAWTYPFSHRGIGEDTFRKFQYGIRKDGVEVAPYYDSSGRSCGLKLRAAGHKFWVEGDVTKDALPFGAQAWARSGKKIVVTEGEIDAMSVSQVQDNRWPVVSIATGAGAQVKQYMAMRREYFKNFEEVILMFDSDEPGQKAAKIAAEALSLPYGQVRLASLPLKDANEMLVAGRIEELVSAVWRAVPYQPGGFVRLEDIKDKILKGVPMGLPWCWPTLTAATYGRRPGEIYTFGAGTGVGKSTVIFQEMAHTAGELNEKVGMVMLETPPAESGLRLASALVGKAFFVPNGEWTEEELQAALTKLDGRVFLYDHFGSVEWEPVESIIRYWCAAEGVKHICIDHLTAFAAAASDERKTLETIMAKIGGLAKELELYVYLVSHLATPEGAPHEEGGRVTIRHFKGSRAVGYWSTHLFGIERDQQSDERETQNHSVLRVLKDRTTGRATGLQIPLVYDRSTARLVEKATADMVAVNEETPF